MNFRINSSIACLLAFSSLAFTPQAARADHSYRFGVEGFYENYKEPDPGVEVDEHAHYGSISADYTHSNNGYFTSVETRGSYGRNNYKSVSGTANSIPQYEGDLRLLTGVNIPVNGVGGIRVIVPYFGLGLRAFLDHSKGVLTSLGFFGYDRRIYQLYLPIGASWQFTHGDFVYTPLIEFDPLLLGKVNSRLKNGGTGDENITNTQRSGFGARGEFMVGQQGKEYGWEAGPFVRYWSVKDSNLAFDSFDSTYLQEPKNTRLQMGAKLRVSF